MIHEELEEIVRIYFDICRDFDLEGNLLFTYTNFHSKENGIYVDYHKNPGVDYIPFVKNGYKLNINIDNV